MHATHMLGQLYKQHQGYQIVSQSTWKICRECKPGYTFACITLYRQQQQGVYMFSLHEIQYVQPD